MDGRIKDANKKSIIGQTSKPSFFSRLREVLGKEPKLGPNRNGAANEGVYLHLTTRSHTQCYFCNLFLHVANTLHVAWNTLHMA
jgi:hypothetical protein